MRVASEETDRSESPDRLTRPLQGLTLAALILRVGYLCLEPKCAAMADEGAWTTIALDKLVATAGFRPLRLDDVFYPPLYLYFLGAASFFGGALEAAKWAQVVVSALLVPAVGRVGLQVVGARGGLIAAGFTACYPELVWYSVHFWSETLFLTLLWWAIERTLATRASATGAAAALGAGVLWGLASLTRETALYFLPLLPLWFAWMRPRGSQRRALLVLLVAGLTIAPWTGRNWVLFRALIPVSTAGSLNLWQGNTALSRAEVYRRHGAVADHAEQHQLALRSGLRAIAARQPTWILEKLASEAPRFWEADSVALGHIRRGAYGPVRLATVRVVAFILQFPYLTLLPLFVLGLLPAARTRAGALILLFLGYTSLIHLITHGFSRYRLPVLPVLFILAGGAWVRLAPTARMLLPSVGALLALATASRTEAPPPVAEPGLEVEYQAGWASPESRYRWTSGHTAVLSFSATPAQGAILEWTLRPFLAPGLVRQRVRMSLNGEPILGLRLDRPEVARHAVGLPARRVRSWNLLSLTLPDAQSPSHLALSEDQRELGVASFGLRLRPFPAFPPSGVLDLGEPAADPYLGDGWSEGAGRRGWTDGQHAELFFAAVPEPDVILDVEFQTFGASGTSQPLELLLNRRRLARLNVGAGNLFHLAIPWSALDRENVVRFRLPKATSSRSLGRGTDAREFGIAVQRLRRQPERFAPTLPTP